MTLAQAKTRVYNLTDLTSADTTETAKFNDFFDEAQKEVVKHIPILKTVSITVTSNVYTNVVTDFYKLIRFHDSDYNNVDFQKVGLTTYRFDTDGTYTMEYQAVPTTITSATADSTAFEIDQSAQDLLPYYVAAAVMDLDSDAVKYNYFMTHYQNKLQNLIANKSLFVVNVPDTFG